MTAADADDRQLLVAAAALLDQGRRIDALSRALTAVALIALLLLPVTLGVPPRWSSGVVAAVALIGLAEAWLACRTGFDAALFAGLATAAEADLAGLDRALSRLGLMPPAKAGRPTEARAAGARRLLYRQGLCFAAQAGLILAGAAIAALRGGS